MVESYRTRRYYIRWDDDVEAMRANNVPRRMPCRIEIYMWLVRGFWVGFADLIRSDLSGHVVGCGFS